MTTVRDTSWRDRLGLERRVATLAAALFLCGFGEELWSRFLPEYLRVLGASAVAVGAFGVLRDLLDAAYAYPGGVLVDRLGVRAALLLFGGFTLAGLGVYWAGRSVLAVFAGLVLVMSWKSLGLPATFALIGEDLQAGRRVIGFTVQAVLKRVPIVLAPPAGGWLLERLGMRHGMRAGFAASVVLLAASLAGLARFLRPSRGSVAQPAAPPPRLRLHSSLRQLLIADCLIRLCEGLPDVFLVIWALEVVRVRPAQFGLLTSALTAASILSYAPAAALAERSGKKSFVVLTFAFFTLFPLAVVLSRTFLSLLGAFVVGGLREIGEPARKALIVDLAAPAARGRTVGFYYSVRGFTVAGAAGIGGALWTIRPELTFLAAAFLGAAGTVWAAWHLPPAPPRRNSGPLEAPA